MANEIYNKIGSICPENAQINKQLIVNVIIPVVTALAIQTYMLFQLAAQVSQLSVEMSQPANQHPATSSLPALVPIQPDSNNDAYGRQRESL